MNKLTESISLLILSGIIMAIGNTVGYKTDLIDSLKGISIIVIIASIGVILSQLPVLKKLPTVFWVSITAILASCPIFPGHQAVLAITKKMQFLAIATPILAYAGLSIGKDLEMFRKLSWRIIPVALAVCAGTFLGAAIIAQLALKWEGII